MNQLAFSVLRRNGVGVLDLRRNSVEEIALKHHNDYDWITKKVGGAGYAHHFLEMCNWSKMIQEADASIYRLMVYIDSQLGTSASQQLSKCLINTTRWDLIEVWN